MTARRVVSKIGNWVWLPRCLIYMYQYFVFILKATYLLNLIYIFLIELFARTDSLVLTFFFNKGEDIFHNVD